MEQEYTRAYLADDGSGHLYLLPYDLTDWFNDMLTEAETNEYEYQAGKITESELNDRYNFNSFEEEFGDYRVEGDYEIYAKF